MTRPWQTSIDDNVTSCEHSTPIAIFRSQNDLQVMAKDSICPGSLHNMRFALSRARPASEIDGAVGQGHPNFADFSYVTGRSESPIAARHARARQCLQVSA